VQCDVQEDVKPQIEYVVPWIAYVKNGLKLTEH
jgi:hypothetical protein